MKKLISAIIGVSAVLFYFSCQKDNTIPATAEESLIEQIVSASTVEALNVADLPPAVSDYVKQNHAPFDIETAFYAPALGYEVTLENGLCLFFGMNGNHLNHNGMHDDGDNYHGSGGNHCLMGDTINITNLPQAVTDYLTGNYPGNTVVTVIVKPSGKLGVELSGGAVLMFSPNGNFIHICEGQGMSGHGHNHGNMGGPGWHCEPGGTGGMGGNHGGMGNQSGPNMPCWGGTEISINPLPAVITTYISANHPGATVVHAMQTFGGKYFLRLSDCARLVFDEDGSILFDGGN